MEINGREIKFLRTVKATSDLAKICPNQDISRIGEIFSEKDISTTIESGAKLIHFLNEGYEMNKHFSDSTYKPNIISVDEIMYLDDETYTKLIQSAMASIGVGAETTIEVETPKKKENHEGVN
jgi:hypothetical protein